MCVYGGHHDVVVLSSVLLGVLDASDTAQGKNIELLKREMNMLATITILSI